MTTPFDIDGMTQPPTAAPPAPKPLLRGWSHLVAFGFAIAAGGALTARAPPGAALVVAAVYSVCLATLFGVSALYHRPDWKPRARAWMRRLDHSGIFLLIAGTFTPISLVLPARERALMLSIGWGGALLGCMRAVLWPRAPKPLAAIIYLALGWAPVLVGRSLFAGLGTAALAWVLAGGALYSVGAICYALKRPSLWPRVFGYHELFHLLVILAAACHFVAVRSVLQRF
jgi:hemolysin III